MARIAVILTDRANYGRLKPIIDALAKHRKFNLQIIVGGSMVLPRFHEPWKELTDVYGHVWCEVEGSMPRSTGLATIGFADHLQRLCPDYCIVIGDRFETLGAATAAAGLRIPLIHFQGGEISGCLDNKWRHAITQLADYHVPATKQAYMQIVQQTRSTLTEDPTPESLLHIIGIGCPSSDLAANIESSTISGDEPLMVSFHPDTDSDRDHKRDMDQVLEAVTSFRCRVYWPNIDEGSDKIAKQIRHWQHEMHEDFETVIYDDPVTYLERLANTICCVGNSSSFVRDAGFFGTPVVLVGDRQRGRECSENVLAVPCESEKIFDAIRKQREHGRYAPSTLYGDGNVTERFIKALEELCDGQKASKETSK